MENKTIKLELTKEEYETIACRFLECIIRIRVEEQNETDEDYKNGLHKEALDLIKIFNEIERQKMEQED